MGRFRSLSRGRKDHYTTRGNSLIYKYLNCKSVRTAAKKENDRWEYVPSRGREKQTNPSGPLP